MSATAYLRLILVVVGMAALTGCAAIITPPDVSVRSITPTGIALTGIDLEVDLMVSNPNRFDLQLLSYSYALQVADQPITTAAARQTTTFPARQEANFKLPINIRYADLLALLQQRPDPDQLPYHLKAELELETPLGKTVIPVNRTGRFALPESYRPATLLQRFKELFKPL